MKNELHKKIILPENMSAELKDDFLIIKSQDKEQKRKINPKFIKTDGREINVECKKVTRKEKKVINTTIAHIKNMISGLENKFVYRLQICHTHFPINVSVDNEKKELVIKNFLGESKPRKAKILNGVDIKIERDIIIIESHNKEAAGQNAANIEKATRIKKRDRRIFQDGIWIISKPNIRKK